jgi:hypothetical protein
MTDPADDAVVYVIEFDEGIKGVLINAYNAYAHSPSPDIVKKLRTITFL